MNNLDKKQLTVGEVKHLLFFGKSKDNSIILDDTNKQIDWFMSQMFIVMAETSRFDTIAVEKIFYERLTKLANL